MTTPRTARLRKAADKLGRTPVVASISSGMTTLNTRWPHATIVRIDGIIAERAATQSYYYWRNTRSDVIRTLVDEALAARAEKAKTDEKSKAAKGNK